MEEQAKHRLSVLLQQALALHRQGRLAEAKAHYESILDEDPHHFDALNMLGTIAGQSRDFQSAVEMIARAIAINPQHAAACNNHGNALKGLGRFDAAVASYDRAIVIKPDYAEAHFNRSIALQELGQLDAAVSSYDRTIAISSDHVYAHNNKGNALKALGRAAEAVASYDKAIQIKPDYAEAWNNRGVALKDQKHFKAALASYDRAIHLRLDYVEAHNNRGNVLQDLKDAAAALVSHDRALAISSDYAEGWNSRGLALQELGRLDEALASYGRAISLKPDDAEAYCNRGVALQESGQIASALENYDTAIRIRPDYAHGYWNKSLALLLNGELGAGWDLFEWGWKNGKRGTERKQIAGDWNGTACDGAVLVLPEQGVGDEIFYSGMLNDFCSLTPNVTVAVDPRLVGLYQRSFPALEVVAKTALAPERKYAAQIYMGSLGQYLRRDMGTLSNAPRGYLRACEVRTAELRSGLRRDHRLLCGLSWSSSNADIGGEKSLRLQQLAPLLALENIDFVDLQYGDTTAEREVIRISTGRNLQSAAGIDNFNDIDGLAALISACDVVVTVSNTTAHLAAALGKPVFVMLPVGSGLLWYWHDGRSDSPWYPSARLYRQERRGDWAALVERVSADLAAHNLP